MERENNICKFSLWWNMHKTLFLAWSCCEHIRKCEITCRCANIVLFVHLWNDVYHMLPDIFCRSLINTFPCQLLNLTNTCISYMKTREMEGEGTVSHWNSNGFDSSPIGQNGRHFTNDDLRWIYMSKFFVFWLKFHWSLFLRVQLTLTQQWF